MRRQSSKGDARRASPLVRFEARSEDDLQGERLIALFIGPEVCSSPWAVRQAPVPPVMAMVTGTGPVRSTSPYTVIWPLGSLQGADSL